MSSNYPPGVTGNEPELTGEWPCDECGGRGYDEDEDGKHSCPVCQGKGFINGDETQGRCVGGCDEITDRWDDRDDEWLCLECRDDLDRDEFEAEEARRKTS